MTLRLGIHAGAQIGTPNQVIDRIGAYSDVGVQGLNINVNAPFNWEALQVFCEEVVPSFS